MKNVSLMTEGKYKCEVVSEGRYERDDAEKNMTVIGQYFACESSGVICDLEVSQSYEYQLLSITRYSFSPDTIQVLNIIQIVT